MVCVVLGTGPDYQADSSGRLAQNFLGNWQGHLLVDGYGGYKPLFSAAASPSTELGCWVRTRRKFFDLHQANGSPMALQALQRIGTLYVIEAQGKNLTIEARCQLRMEKSLPVLKALDDWLKQIRTQTANRGGSPKCWTILRNYMDYWRSYSLFRH